MSIRHIKESNYIFTAQAYEAYMHIDVHLLESFWHSFEQDHCIDKGDIIFSYMIEAWCSDTGYTIRVPQKYIVDDLVHELIKNGKNFNMINVFNHPTFVVYKGVIYPSAYDLEFAESIFSKYERESDESSYFGHLWWDMYDFVHGGIKKLVKFHA